jgi:hypothetical protein
MDAIQIVITKAYLEHFVLRRVKNKSNMLNMHVYSQYNTYAIVVVTFGFCRGIMDPPRN